MNSSTSALIVLRRFLAFKEGLLPMSAESKESPSRCSCSSASAISLSLRARSASCSSVAVLIKAFFTPLYESALPEVIALSEMIALAGDDVLADFGELLDADFRSSGMVYKGTPVFTLTFSWRFSAMDFFAATIYDCDNVAAPPLTIASLSWNFRFTPLALSA